MWALAPGIQSAYNCGVRTTVMERYQRALLTLAILGWLGAIRSQLRAVRADDEGITDQRIVARNRYLLLASLSMNSLVATVLYRGLRRLWR